MINQCLDCEPICLRVRSEYSGDGSASIRKIIERGAELGYPAITVTDDQVVKAWSKLQQEAARVGIRPIFGVELPIFVDDPDRYVESPGRHQDHLTFLAENGKGIDTLFAASSRAATQPAEACLPLEFLAATGTGITAVTNGADSWLYRAVLRGEMRVAKRYLTLLVDALGREHLAVGLPVPDPVTLPQVKILAELAEEFGLPVVAGHLALFASPDGHRAHQVLQSRRHPERPEAGLDPGSYLPSPAVLADSYRDLPGVAGGTRSVVDRCRARIENRPLVIPASDSTDPEGGSRRLTRLVNEAIPERYGEGRQAEARARAEQELEVIEGLGLADYFLIYRDLVNFVKQSGHLVGPGRGAAGGSIVNFLLGITEVDPIEHDLFFSRFLNADGRGIPDIDLDLSPKGRAVALTWLRSQFGGNNVLEIATRSRIHPKHAVRIAARDVIGNKVEADLAADEINRILPQPSLGHSEPLEVSLATRSGLQLLCEEDSVPVEILDLALHLEGSISVETSHSACFALADPASLAPVPVFQYPTRAAAPDRTSRTGRIVTQFSRFEVESLGVMNIDLLILRNLGLIENTLSLIRENHGIDISLEDIPLDDSEVYEMITRGDADDVLDLVDPGTRKAVTNIGPTNFGDLVAALTLHRPGAEKLIPEFIAAGSDPDSVEYLDQRLKPILESTRGLVLFQEQQIRMAVELAGFTPDRADFLRRAVGKKKRDDVLAVRSEFISGLEGSGIEAERAERIWHLCEDAGGISFNRSHAVAYSLITYREAWLKTYYPEEFQEGRKGVVP